MMGHYLPDWIDSRHPWTSEEWNKLIDDFEVERLARQLEQVGAGYYLISIGQNSGFYLAPNQTYDRLVGIAPSKCSRRDLVADLYQALSKRGIRMLVYLPSGAPDKDRVAMEKLQWKRGHYPNREFLPKWEQAVRDWSLRWGDKVSGGRSDIHRTELESAARQVRIPAQSSHGFPLQRQLRGSVQTLLPCDGPDELLYQRTAGTTS